MEERHANADYNDAIREILREQLSEKELSAQRRARQKRNMKLMNNWHKKKWQRIHTNASKANTKIDKETVKTLSNRVHWNCHRCTHK